MNNFETLLETVKTLRNEGRIPILRDVDGKLYVAGDTSENIISLSEGDTENCFQCDQESFDKCPLTLFGEGYRTEE